MGGHAPQPLALPGPGGGCATSRSWASAPRAPRASPGRPGDSRRRCPGGRHPARPGRARSPPPGRSRPARTDPRRDSHPPRGPAPPSPSCRFLSPASYRVAPSIANAGSARRREGVRRGSDPRPCHQQQAGAEGHVAVPQPPPLGRQEPQHQPAQPHAVPELDERRWGPPTRGRSSPVSRGSTAGARPRGQGGRAGERSRSRARPADLRSRRGRGADAACSAADGARPRPTATTAAGRREPSGAGRPPGPRPPGSAAHAAAPPGHRAGAPARRGEGPHRSAAEGTDA